MSTPKKVTDAMLEEFDWLILGRVDPARAAQQLGVSLRSIERGQKDRRDRDTQPAPAAGEAA